MECRTVPTVQTPHREAGQFLLSRFRYRYVKFAKFAEFVHDLLLFTFVFT